MKPEDHIYSIGIGAAIKYDPSESAKENHTRKIKLVTSLLEELFGDDFLELSWTIMHSQSVKSYEAEHPGELTTDNVVQLKNFKKLETIDSGT